MSIIAIAAVDKGFGIGYKNDLLFHIHEDMKFFKQTTINHIVVMGKNTFASMGYNLLPNRYNIVISTSLDYMKDRDKDKLFIGSLDKVKEKIKSINDDIYIIGGARVYNEFIDDCDYLLLTHYGDSVKNVDTYFPSPTDHGFYIDAKITEGVFNGVKWEIWKWIKR